jgi:transposase InsO family protein
LVPRERVFPSDLAQWRESAIAALAQPEEARATAQETRKDRRRIKELEKGPRAQREGAGGDHSAAGAEKKTASDLPREQGRMISLEDRQSIARAVDEAHRGGARLRRARAEAGITLRTLQRWKGGEGLERGDLRPQAVRPARAHALSEAEREEIMRIANEPRFAESPPARIVPMLADQGVYVVSESSFSHVLRAHGQSRHRGRAKAPQRVCPPSTHVVSAPRQVFCWDMTYLTASVAGRWYFLYPILDLCSRKIVGFEVHESDDSEHAVNLVRRTALAEDLYTLDYKPVLHGDNGATLKATTVLAVMNWLGLRASYSRPRVSDDNAFVESLFRTAKYRPQFPAKGFADLDHARQWANSFVQWCNHDHRHSAIRYVSPAQRHAGEDHTVLQARHALPQRAREENPRRWARHTRKWNPISVVMLNPERDAVITAATENLHNSRTAA